MFSRTLLLCLSVASACVVAATPALAAKAPAPTAGASIALNGSASFGSSASFVAVDPPTKWIQEVSVSCWQNGREVYFGVQTVGSTGGTYTPSFMLWSMDWAAAGGASANCTADLFYYTWQGKTETGRVDEANTSFVAARA